MIAIPTSAILCTTAVRPYMENLEVLAIILMAGMLACLLMKDAEKDGGNTGACGKEHKIRKTASVTEVRCSQCGEMIVVDESNIADGDTFNVTCRKCGASFIKYKQKNIRY